MNTDSGHTSSLWMKTAALPSPPPLSQNSHCDVCIVGGGIAGLSTAYLLSLEGKSVIVLDDGPLGGGATCRTTAHLSNAIDDLYTEIERLHGEKGAQLAADSHTAAIKQIEKNIGAESIECDFEWLDGFLFVPPGDKSAVLEEELNAAHRAGLIDVAMLDRAPLETFNTGPCLRFPRQAQFHPLKYLAGLVHAIEMRGGRLYTSTHVTQIQGGDHAEVQTSDGFRVTAQAVIVATNTPVNDLFALHTKQYAYRSYVIAVPVPTGSVRKALYWDTADPYHYVRLHSLDGVEMLIVGGEDHKTGQADDAEDRFIRLFDWARERFPITGPIKFRWSGQVMEPVDGLAFIGRNPMDKDNVFIATGDSGMGMTHGTIASMLLTDLILQRQNPWANLYDPSRISLRSAPEFVQENVNFGIQYVKHFTAGDVNSPDEIPSGAGAVVKEGLKKVAVYRDDQGQCHRFSALCPHLGCVVAWNSLEKTWDCPCHGSRFARDGRVVNGPANIGLPAA
jgi:glycine/D-amino acid oxidase-like deaminating enzyme/nitrite reductase/ring-hydroxylating ferredoxin subunit